MNKETKPQTKSIDLVNPVELAKIATPQPKPVVPIKPAAKTAPKPSVFEQANKQLDELEKPATKVAAPPTLPTPPVQAAAPAAPSPLAAFSALVDKAPKEHLPTMLVKLANRCISEKVFATGKELADAIVGASKVK